MFKLALEKVEVLSQKILKLNTIFLLISRYYNINKYLEVKKHSTCLGHVSFRAFKIQMSTKLDI